MSKRVYEDEIGCIVEENILDGNNEKIKLTTKCIIEEYKINNCKYRIMYTEDVKASEVFNALNRMIVSGKEKDIQNNIQIFKLFEPSIISIPVEKKKWWRI